MPLFSSDLIHLLLHISAVALSAWFFIAYYFYQKKYKALKLRAEAAAQIEAQKNTKDWKADALQAKRLQSDELADKTVEHFMTTPNGKELMNHLFVTLKRNNQPLPDDIDEDIKAYFETSSKLPDWANQDLIAFGEDFYLQNGVLICMLLFYKSLPQCYTGANGALVLLQTAQLNDKSHKLDKLSERLAFTGTFIYRAVMPGSLLPDNQGIVATQKIRLIHAMARYYILHRQRVSWDSDTLGIPVNQEDMAGTLMAFSALVLEGLEMLGVTMTVAERESYIHCWRVIGHILGVKEDMIPANSADALALGHAIINHQMGASDAGTILTDALLNFCNKKSPFFISSAFHRSMMRFLMGDKLADLLGIQNENPKRSSRFIAFVKGYVRVRERAKKYIFFRFLLQRIDKILLRLSYFYLGKKLSKNVHFRLPEKLEKMLGVASKRVRE